MTRLNLLLLINAGFCLVVSSFFVLRTELINHFLGNHIPLLLYPAAFVLAFHGLHLISFAVRRIKTRFELMYFIVFNAAWLVFTLLLIFTGVVITNSYGIFASLGAAFIAELLGGMLFLEYKKHEG